MGTRVDLQTKLSDILGSDQVYFQPPATIKMKYPAIVYSLDNIYTMHANNAPYFKKRRYQVTYITKNPDSEFIDSFMDSMSSVEFDRHFTSDNLHHYVYTLYY